MLLTPPSYTGQAATRLSTRVLTASPSFGNKPEQQDNKPAQPQTSPLKSIFCGALISVGSLAAGFSVAHTNFLHDTLRQWPFGDFEIKHIVPPSPKTPEFRFLERYDSRNETTAEKHLAFEKTQRLVEKRIFYLLENRPDLLAKVQQKLRIDLLEGKSISPQRAGEARGSLSWNGVGGKISMAQQALWNDLARKQGSHEIVSHELTHFLDFLVKNGDTIDMPHIFTLECDGLFPDWTAEEKTLFEMLRAEEWEKIKKGESILFRNYAGKNAAEFLACAVEVYVENPHLFYMNNPRLFHLINTVFQRYPDEDFSMAKRLPGLTNEQHDRFEQIRKRVTFMPFYRFWPNNEYRAPKTFQTRALKHYLENPTDLAEVYPEITLLLEEYLNQPSVTLSAKVN